MNLRLLRTAAKKLFPSATEGESIARMQDDLLEKAGVTNPHSPQFREKLRGKNISISRKTAPTPIASDNSGDSAENAVKILERLAAREELVAVAKPVLTPKHAPAPVKPPAAGMPTSLKGKMALSALAIGAQVGNIFGAQPSERSARARDIQAQLKKLDDEQRKLGFSNERNAKHAQLTRELDAEIKSLRSKN